MLKLALAVISFLACTLLIPEVKVAGALRNIMIDGDLSAHIDLDTLNKKSLYGLGPVAGLKGEIVIIDGTVYSSAKEGDTLRNGVNTIAKAAMLVYSKVETWKEVKDNVEINSYAELEKWIKATAIRNGYDTGVPFPFLIKAAPLNTDFHVIDWKAGAVHSMDNHKEFAYLGSFKNKPVEMLGFYSDKHKSIFTHHTTNMHIHLLEPVSKTTAHLDDVKLAGPVSILFPER